MVVLLSSSTISKVGGELNAYYGHEIAGVYQNEAEIAADPIAVLMI